MKPKTIYSLSFFRPNPTTGAFFFSSLSAIYEMFSEEEIGCKLSNLWANERLKQNNYYVNQKVAIYRALLHSKPNKQTKKHDL